MPTLRSVANVMEQLSREAMGVKADLESRRSAIRGVAASTRHELRNLIDQAVPHASQVDTWPESAMRVQAHEVLAKLARQFAQEKQAMAAWSPDIRAAAQQRMKVAESVLRLKEGLEFELEGRLRSHPLVRVLGAFAPTGSKPMAGNENLLPIPSRLSLRYWRSPEYHHKLWKDLRPYERQVGPAALANQKADLDSLQREMGQLAKEVDQQEAQLRPLRKEWDEREAHRQAIETGGEPATRIHRALVDVVSEAAPAEQLAWLRVAIPELHAPALVLHARLEGSDRLSQRLQPALDAVTKMCAQIKTNLDKLNKGVRRVPNKMITFDEAGVSRQVRTALSQFEALPASVSNALDRIERLDVPSSDSTLGTRYYDRAVSDPSTSPMNWLLMYMVIESLSAPDASAAGALGLGHMLGMPGLDASALSGLDPSAMNAVDPSTLDGLLPDSSFSPDGLVTGLGGLDSVQTAGMPDSSSWGLDSPAMDIAMPAMDLSMPQMDISMPSFDISMPSMDIPSMDFGSSFDSGSSMSSFGMDS